MLSRTEEIISLINLNFNSVNNTKKLSTYSEIGKENYHFPFWPLYTWLPDSKAYAIDAMKVMNSNSDDINILDIGCGAGQFIYAHHGGNRHVYGVSLDDTCASQSLISIVNDQIEIKRIPQHENHFKGNAEQIDSISLINNRTYHYIFSRFTFLHFTDPLGSLQKAYALLADNGLLMVDMLILRGLSDPMPLLYFLHKQGYEFITSPWDNSCLESFQQISCGSVLSCFFIRKTKPTLELPLSYQECILSKSHKSISYTYTDVVANQLIDYQEADFILKIADNEWVQAYALQKLLLLNAELVTNNPQFNPLTGKFLLEESLQKLSLFQIPIVLRASNYFEMYIRTDANLDTIEKLQLYYNGPSPKKSAMSFIRPISVVEIDCYGNEPIHLIVRLDNVELFKYMIKRFPELLKEKSQGNNPQTLLEMAEEYNNYCNGTKIFKYLEQNGYYIKDTNEKSPHVSLSIYSSSNDKNENESARTFNGFTQ